MVMETEADLAPSLCRFRILQVVIGLHLATGVARAQTVPPPAPLTPVQAEQVEAALRATERREAVVVYPSALSGTILSNAGLVAGDKNKRAFIHYAFRPNDLADVVLSASSPLADEGATNIVQLGGLSDKATLGVQVRFGRHTLPTDKQNAAIFNRLWTECLKVVAARERDDDAADDERDDTGIVESGCNFEDLNSDLLAEVIAPYRRTSWFFAFEGAVSPQAFSFVDPVTFEDVKVREWSSTGSVSLGALFSNNVYASARVRFEDAYTSSKSQAVCPSSSEVRICPVKPVGVPPHKRRAVIEGEWRRFLGPHVGVSPVLRYDWKSSDVALEVPIYFIRDKEGGLRSGIAYGHAWSDAADASGHGLAVFLSQTFGLTGR